MEAVELQAVEHCQCGHTELAHCDLHLLAEDMHCTSCSCISWRPAYVVAEIPTEDFAFATDGRGEIIRAWLRD